MHFTEISLNVTLISNCKSTSQHLKPSKKRFDGFKCYETQQQQKISLSVSCFTYSDSLGIADSCTEKERGQNLYD